MKSAPQRPAKTSPYEGLGADALLAILAEKDADHERQLQERERAIEDRDHLIKKRDRSIRERDTRIKLLEEHD